jgi:cobalt-zinc-cadmium efflux system membrane fusion protein
VESDEIHQMNFYAKPVMKYIQYLLVATCAICAQRPAFAEEKADAVRKANSVGLTEIEVKNLGIETAAVVPTEFEETIFSLGRIEAISSKRAIVSSRIPGRIVKLGAFEGDVVTAGQEVATIESRQPGNPPPRTTLRAPLGGLVMSTHSSLGEPIEPDTDILEIIDLSEVYAVARVPEDQAGKIRPGTPARIFIPAFPEESFEGELLRFGTTADRASGTIDAIFHLKGLDGHIRPAMRAEFSIVLSSRENVMAVPKEALQGDNVAPFVFVKDFELKNVFVKAPLRVGARNDRFVEVIGGLFPGDEVVTKGAYPLAFAGEGSVSLKDALDQAHGHEHNEDGSELTAAQKSAGEGGDGGGATDFGPMVMFLGILCVLLAGLLVLSLVFRSKSQTENDDA